MYLNCHTSLSFRYGTLSVEELFDQAKRCGVSKLALTEINNTASYIEMLRLCRQNEPVDGGLTRSGTPGYRLDIAVGLEFRRGNELLYVALARNNSGFEELNRFASHHNASEKAIPKKHLSSMTFMSCTRSEKSNPRCFARSNISVFVFRI